MEGPGELDLVVVGGTGNRRVKEPLERPWELDLVVVGGPGSPRTNELLEGPGDFVIPGGPNGPWYTLEQIIFEVYVVSKRKEEMRKLY